MWRGSEKEGYVNKERGHKATILSVREGWKVSIWPKTGGLMAIGYWQSLREAQVMGEMALKLGWTYEEWREKKPFFQRIK